MLHFGSPVGMVVGVVLLVVTTSCGAAAPAESIQGAQAVSSTPSASYEAGTTASTPTGDASGPMTTASSPSAATSSAHAQGAVRAMSAAGTARRSSQSAEYPCSALPPAASVVSLRTRLSFPATVTPSSRGKVSVRNVGSRTVTLAVAQPLPAVTVRGGKVTSTGPQAGSGATRVAIAPGQLREFSVVLLTNPCDSHGHGLYQRRIRDGDHQVVALLQLQDGRQVASTSTAVTFRSS